MSGERGDHGPTFGPDDIPIQTSRGLDYLSRSMLNAAEEATETCVICGEERGSHEFHDGLRCIHCAEADEKPNNE